MVKKFTKRGIERRKRFAKLESLASELLKRGNEEIQIGKNKLLDGAQTLETAGNAYLEAGDEERGERALRRAAENYDFYGQHSVAEELYRKIGAHDLAEKAKARKKSKGIGSLFVILVSILGLYFLFSNVNITGGVVTGLSSISSNFLVNFILVGILGLICYSYLK